jgi:hypothetical protein
VSKGKVLFLHGLSSDGGRKTAFMRSLGYDVTTPHLSDWSFHRAVAQAQAVYDELQPDVVVGSSRGGSVAMNMESGETPLILLAPAWKRWGKVDRIRRRGFIIHSPHDSTVPYDDSVTLWVNSVGLELIAAGADHRLNDTEAQQALAFALEQASSSRTDNGNTV